MRIAAAGALEALGRPRPPTGIATTARKPADYRSLVAQSREARWVRIETTDGSAIVRIDTPVEINYYRNGGILHTVLRNLLKAGA